MAHSGKERPALDQGNDRQIPLVTDYITHIFFPSGTEIDIDESSLAEYCNSRLQEGDHMPSSQSRIAIQSVESISANNSEGQRSGGQGHNRVYDPRALSHAQHDRHFFHSSGVGAKPQKKPQKRRKRKERRKEKEKEKKGEKRRGAMGLIRHEAKKQCGRVSGVRIEPQYTNEEAEMISTLFLDIGLARSRSSLSLPPSSSLIVAASSSGPDL
ncbi:hypothetical protein THAOC_26961 [Thalassiosira oceanica]|uniref:Uncharacterized protein n=1 Tax=Thalassiosira oceanica TaxID=159749 RepID=K0S3V4_THAOC|nr:hypothetical protein THAOC_26961 [Thalassiosira oceanica]|eukprot:EJK53577.1 hypothetical protein THAOC_26961 [Thalassiosira oceanica]